jgi:hypothetical protein
MQFMVTGAPPPSEPEPMVAPLADEEPHVPRTRTEGDSAFWDYLVFRRMITPIIIQIIFWLGVVLITFLGLWNVIQSFGSTTTDGGVTIQKRETSVVGILLGLLTLFLGPIIWRVYCEILILVFRMNETLTDILRGITRMAKD